MERTSVQFGLLLLNKYTESCEYVQQPIKTPSAGTDAGFFAAAEKFVTTASIAAMHRELNRR